MMAQYFHFSLVPGCKPEQQMMYAGSKNKLVQTVELTKVMICTLLCMSYDASTLFSLLNCITVAWSFLWVRFLSGNQIGSNYCMMTFTSTDMLQGARPCKTLVS